MSDWNISRKADRCTLCGRAFAGGESVFSAIFAAEDPEEGVFERVDACPGCFENSARAPFSRWVSRVPDGSDKAPLLDLQMAREFLVRLAAENDPERRGLMYILTLLLMRKRKVKLLAQRRETEATVMEISVPREEGDPTGIEIIARELSEEEAAGIEAELGRLFGLRSQGKTYGTRGD